MLDDLRVEHGRLDQPLPVGELGGTLRVELNHIDMSSLPAGFRANGRDDNDSRILAVAHNLASEGHDVTLVSKDLPMRVKASAMGLAAEEYRGVGTGRVGVDGHGGGGRPGRGDRCAVRRRRRAGRPGGGS